MNAIEIQGLAKTYRVGFWRKREHHALRPLDLEVREGEVFGYLGPNGAGKTTTLKLLMGLIFPTAGSAKVLGLDSQDPQVKAQIGFLPEQPYFYDYLTANELLEYYAQLSGVPAKERRKKVEQMLTRVGLGGAGNIQLRKFSKGMLQRVGIAQAILHGPKVVFLDEPMSGLDPIGRREVRDLIHELREEGRTVFFSTHILSDAEDLCDRVAVLHHGELRGVGVVAELMTRDHNRIEVLWHGKAVVAGVQALGAACTATGETIRAVCDEACLEAVLEELRRARARLVSVMPVRPTLEEYFIERLAEAAHEKPEKVAAP